MPPKLAVLFSLGFTYWLIVRDLQVRQGVSRAVWIPWLWLTIVSSRPVCLWFGFGMGSGDGYAEGTPLDRLVYMALIFVGLRVLAKRRVQLGVIISANRWLFILFLYWGISIFWSDYPFISFKRWIKDLGNVVMILVILSEVEPVEAVKAVFLRCVYLLIPMSVVFIKYFPDLGRTLEQWTWVYTYTGVAQQKNALGSLVVFSGLFLIWDTWLAETRKRPADWKERLAPYVLLGMCFWLLHMANSATSLICLILGGALLVGFRLPLFRSRPKAFTAFLVAATVFGAAFDSVFGFREMVVTSVGRNMSLTTRTDLWQLLLEQHTNPIFGTGFYSFWMGQRLAAVWRVFEGLTQAHNGYLETYLNGGLIAVTLLAIWLLASFGGIRSRLGRGSDFARMQFTLWVIVLISNFTEASFNRLSPVWLLALLAGVQFPMRPAPARQVKGSGYSSGPVRAEYAEAGAQAFAVARI